MSDNRCPFCDGIFTPDTVPNHSCIKTLLYRIEGLEKLLLWDELKAKEQEAKP